MSRKKSGCKCLLLFLVCIIASVFGISTPQKTLAGSVHYFYPYQRTNSIRYDGDAQQSFTMMGQKFNHGITVDSDWYDTKLGFNVTGITSVSFVVGHIDGGDKDSRTMKIWLDDVLLDNYTTSLTSDMINKTITINTVGHTQLYILLEGEGDYGLGDIIQTGSHSFSSEITKVCSVKADGEKKYTCDYCGFSYKEKMPKQTYCNPYMFPYQVSNFNIYNEAEGSSTNYKVMGNMYYKGLVVKSDWYDSEALYNLNGLYKTFTFTVGDLDGGDSDNRTLYVYVDGNEMRKVSLTPYMMNEKVTVDVDGAAQVKLYLDGEGDYAVFDVYGEPKVSKVKSHSFEDVVTVEAQFGVAGIITHKCTDCGASYTSVTKPLTRSIKGCNISLSSTKYTYNGKAFTPGVKVLYDNEALKKGTDYTVKYLNNKNPGTAKVVIYGKGNYTGTVSKVFAIQKKVPKITVSKTSYVKLYGSKPFTISASASNKAKVTYSVNNKKVVTLSGRTVKIVGCGTAIITVKSAASTYYSSAVKKIKIIVKPKKAVLSSVSSKNSGSLKISWKKDSKASGYEIKVSPYSNMSYAKTITINSSNTTSYVLNNLSGKTKYYVQVRAFSNVGGSKVYSDASVKKAATTKKYSWQY